MEAVNNLGYLATCCSSFLCLLQRREAKVNSSTELVEVLGPTGLFGRDALRRVLGRRLGMIQAPGTGTDTNSFSYL